MGYLRTTLLVLSAGLLAACAGRQIRPDEQVLHLRWPVGAGSSSVAVAELQLSDGEPARLKLLKAAPGARLVLLASASEPDAEAFAEGMRTGGSPQLPHDLASARDAAGLAGPLPAPVALPTTLEAPLAGWTLRLEQADDRYGPGWILVLRDPEGHPAEIQRFAAPVRTVRLPASTVALVETEAGGGGLHIRDAASLDLTAAAGRLLAERSKGEPPARALELLDRAATLAPGASAIDYRRAEALAEAAAPLDQVLASLRAAIDREPVLYRMQARTSRSFVKLRSEPAFQALTAPRALYGTNRAGRPAR